MMSIRRVSSIMGMVYKSLNYLSLYQHIQVGVWICVWFPMSTTAFLIIKFTVGVSNETLANMGFINQWISIQVAKSSILSYNCTHFNADKLKWTELITYSINFVFQGFGL